MTQHRKILGTVAHAGPVLVFVHDHIQPPVQFVVSRPGDFTPSLSQNGVGASRLTPLPSSERTHRPVLPMYEQMGLFL